MGSSRCWRHNYFMALVDGDISVIDLFADKYGVDVRLSPADPSLVFESYIFADVVELTSSTSFVEQLSMSDDEQRFTVDIKLDAVRPLHVACGQGHAAVVEYLITKGADINARTPSAQISPILAAMLCRKSSLSIPGICATLVRRGAHLDFCHDVCGTPLHHAVHLRSVDIIASLLEARDQFPDTVQAALCVANNRGETPLQSAVRDRLADCVALLVAAGADVNVPDETGCVPLMMAVQNNDAETLRVLLTADDCDVNDVGSRRVTALAYAAYLDNETMISMLLSAGADADRCCDMTPLMSAASKGRESVARLLIAGGASVSRTNRSGYTALHYAAREGHVGVVHLLLASGASDDVQGLDGRTPLGLACHAGRSEAAAVFIDRQCSVDNMDNDGDTSLSCCALMGDLSTAKLLVEHGATVSATNRANVTPIWNAAYGGHVDVLCYLIDVGNPPLSTASRGLDQQCAGLYVPFIYDVEHTPLYVAVDRRHDDIVDMLLNRGVDMRDERWYWNGQYPIDVDQKLLGRIDDAARNASSLATSVRTSLRKCLGTRFRDTVLKLTIPALLKQFLVR